MKRDSTAIVAVHWDEKATEGAARLAPHLSSRCPTSPWTSSWQSKIRCSTCSKRYRVREVWFDPYQMQASAQRLRREGVPIEGFPQSVSNLTEASQNLYELIKGGNFVTYPDAAVRLAVSRAVAVETARGWRIAKDKQSHKIDVVVALAMAALAAVRAGESTYNWEWVDDFGGAVPEQFTGSPAAAVGRNAADLQRIRQTENQMRLLHRDGSLFGEQGTLRRRVARDRDVVCVPLDRGSRGRFALIQ